MSLSLQCPSCGKEAAEASPICRRCHSDLALLFTIKRQSIVARRQAIRDLRSDRLEACLENCESSWQQCPTGEAAQIGYLAAILQKDPVLVLKWDKRSSGRTNQPAS